MARLRPWGWWAVGAVVALAGAVWWLSRSTPVPAVTVQQAPLVRTLQVTARVATLSRVEVGATLTGRVQRVLVRDGDRVRSGQVLLELERDELQAAVAQARAQEEQAAAALRGLRSTGRASAQAAVAQTRAAVVATQAELDRSRALVAQGFISASRLDELQRAVDVARAQEQQAQAQRQAQAEQGSDTAQAQAQLAVARAATQAAAARLAQAAIRAPADGQVLLRAVEPGQIVQPGKPLMNLALDGPTQLLAQPDERFLDQLRVGQKATVVADAFPAQRLAAAVVFIAPGIDAQRGAVDVKLALDAPPPPFLREDMTLSAEIETGRRDTALVLPLAALRNAPGESATGGTVLVAEGGRAAERPVQLGLRNLTAVEVTGGLSAGDVVLLGSAVQAGERITPEQRGWDPLAPSPGTAARAAGRGEDGGTALTNAMGR